MMLLSIALGLVTAVIVAFLWGAMKVGSFSTVEEDGTTNRLGCFFHIGWGWLVGAIFGTGVWFANYFSTQNIADIKVYYCLIWATTALFAMLIAWWLNDGSSVAEALWFIVLSTIVFVAGATPAARAIVEHVPGISDFERSVWPTLAEVLYLCTNGIVIASGLLNASNEKLLDAEEAEEAGEEDKAKAARKAARMNRRLGIVAGVLFLLAILALLIFGINWSALKQPAPEPKPEPEVEEPAREAWYTFGVFELLEDEDETNNANFGRDLYVKDMTPEQAWAAVKAEAYRNPINGITTTYYNDVLSGNRLLESYYLQFDNDVDAVNEAIRYYVTGANKYDNTKYNRLVTNLFDFVESNQMELELYTSKELKKMGASISDQFYCNPFSNFYDEDGVQIPAAIIYDCGTGEEEVYLHVTYKPKYATVEWWIHLGCGGQLANVSGKLRVTVEKNPYVPTPSKSSSNPPKTTVIPKTTTTTVPVPKVITNGTPAGVTVGPTLDDNTNGDPNWSSKDTDQHSSRMTDAEYREETDDLREVNEVSREGGTPNTPSTSTPTSTTVDNPGDSGTPQNGNVGIDPLTPTSEIIHEADNGRPYNNTVETAEGSVDLSGI